MGGLLVAMWSSIVESVTCSDVREDLRGKHEGRMREFRSDGGMREGWENEGWEGGRWSNGD